MKIESGSTGGGAAMSSVSTLLVATRGCGLYEITRQVNELVQGVLVEDGLCSMMVQHTSASLTIQENADPSARRDLERWLARLVPEGDPLYTHTSEGPDDMPAHIRAALTSATLAIPVVGGQLALGTWQGVYLWEHRRLGSQRRLVVHCG